MKSNINISGKWLGMTLLMCLLMLAVTGGTAHASAPMPLTITANNATKAAGQVMTLQKTEFKTSGLLPGDSLTVTLTSAGTPVGAAAGSYPIVPSAAVFTPGSASANYTITYSPGTLTVSPSPASIALPEYRKPILMPVSQNNAWTNMVPNALADYFTYVPYSTADAVKLGFPSSCGRLPGDIASTDDCYTISVKKFQQQLALPGIFGGGQGLLDAAGNPVGATVWSHGYGSGGAGWMLPYYDTSKPGVLANTPVTGNAPAPFSDGTLSSAGIWHFPAPTIKGTHGRPIRVQWLNELPNEKPAGFDPTVCDAAPLDCFPYNRVVTHVHGAHVGPESDGLAHAWYSPGFADKGLFWESTRQHGPEGTYFYPMDQEASTIWYHDHAVGITHNNTNMGMAGFFPITDSNEKRLQGIPNPATKVIPTGSQELGFALQDRIFYDDGQVAMPDAPILDPKHPGILNCLYTTDPINGDIIPTVPGDCSPLFMKAPDGHLIPYPLINIPNPPPQAYLATSATLEFFGNIPVVNGVTYGKYNVDKGVYRLRFIGGTDSRAWGLRLKVDGSSPPRYLPFWVIGTEQGLLNNAVMSEQLLIMPGERYDVLVDFKSAAVLNDAGVLANQSLDLGGQRVILENWAGDGPYGGEIIEQVNTAAAAAFRSVDIPEVMVFDVSSNSVVGDVPSPTTALALRTAEHKIPTLTATTTRNVSLVEIIDGFDRIMPTLDGRGFMEFPVTELPRLNTTEQWDIINTTVDAHPMHLHQVAFLLINREATASVVPALIIPPYNAATYVGSGVVEPPGDHEAGWKDTVMCPPGKVTRVIATYDIPGAYVWHCHILSHEEHDMMRPMVVTTPATSVSLTASALSQPTGTTITPIDLTAQAFTAVTAYPVGSGFEYDFVATKGGIPIAEQPIRPSPKFLSSNNDAFNMVRYASWTPPNITGTYTITVNTKAMGADVPNPVQTASILYTVFGPSIVNSTSTTPNGSYNAGKTVDITLTFNQPISSAAGLTIGLSSGASIITGPLSNASAFSGIYTVAVGENTSSLNVTSVTGTITDAVGANAVLNPSVPVGFNISNSRSIIIDTVTPVTSINQVPGTYSGPLTVSMSTTHGDTIHYTITSDVLNAMTPVTATIVGNASFVLNAAVTTTFNVQYYATDAAGNIETGKSAVYTIHVADLTNATVAINNGAQFTNNPVVTLSFTATDPLGITQMQIACDGVTFAAIEVYPSLSSRTCTLAGTDGSKAVAVKFIDTAGTVYPPVSSTIILDTVAPVSIASSLTGNYNGAINVALTSEANAQIYYSISGIAPIVTPTQLYNGPITIPATTTLKYFAADRAGNQEPVQSQTYTIAGTDLVGSVSINNNSPFTNTTAVMLNLAATDPLGVDKYMVSDDGINYQTVNITPATTNFTATIPWILSAGDGVKTVYVKYMDTPVPSNVYGPFAASITVDNIAPAISVSTPQSGTIVNAASVTVNGTVTDAGGVKIVTVNGTAVTVAPNGSFVSQVTIVTGANTITVVAADMAGNSATVTRTVTLDTVIPVTAINPAPGTYSGNVTVTLSSKPGATIYYSINGQAPTTSSSSYSGPFVLSASVTTTYNIQYFAIDAAGNVEQVQSVIYTIHVSDLTNASVVINKGALFTNNPNVVLALSATDPSGITQMQVACDGVAFEAEEAFSTSRTCILSPGDGLKSVAVKFIDGAGIVYDPVTSQITLDTVVPVTSATPGAAIYGGSVKVALTASKNAAIYYTFDGTEPTKSSTKYSAPIVLNAVATSTINLKFFAVDQAGNVEATQTLVYTLHTGDLSQAVVTINNGAQFTNSPTVTLALAASDPNGVPQMQVACDGVSFSAPEPFAATRTCDVPAGDGLKTVEVKYIDGLGTVYPPVPAQITLDTAAAVTTSTPVSGTYSGSVSVTLSANETAKIYFTADGSEPAANAANLYTGTFDLNSPVTKQYSVKYYAVDQAGNRETTKTMIFTLHVSDLVGSINIDSGAPYTAGSAVTLTLSAVDPAGVDSMQFSNDGINFSPLETYAASKAWHLNPGDGLKTVYVRFTDGTGSDYTFSANILLAAAAATAPVGDLDGDGNVDISDALKALQISIGLATATNDELVRGDVAPLVNSKPVPDGKIDIVDVLVILRRSIGLVTW